MEKSVHYKQFFFFQKKKLVNTNLHKTQKLDTIMLAGNKYMK